jgi:hypothetical protein
MNYCGRGHPRTEENTYMYRNSPRCRVCKRDARPKAAPRLTCKRGHEYATDSYTNALGARVCITCRDLNQEIRRDARPPRIPKILYLGNKRLDELHPINGVPMSCREIGDLTGVSHQRIDQYLQRALAKLRISPIVLGLGYLD